MLVVVTGELGAGARIEGANGMRGRVMSQELGKEHVLPMGSGEG